MEAQKYWFSSGANFTPGFTIKNSLMFNGSQNLSKASHPAYSDYSFSAWVKLGLNDSSQVGSTVFGISDGGGSDASYVAVQTSDSDGGNKVSYITGVPGSPARSKGTYTDASGWVHVLATKKLNEPARLYLNGHQQDNGDTTGLSAGGNLAIGVDPYGPRRFFRGLVADVHYVGGKTLGPQDFGVFNEEGAWTPILPTIALNKTTYSDDLFTSGDLLDLTTTDKNFAPGAAANAVFNGINTSEARCDDADGWILYRPSDPILAIGNLKVTVRNCSQIWVNGTNLGLSQTSDTLTTVDLTSALSFSSNGLRIYNIAIKGDGADAAGWSEVIAGSVTMIDGRNFYYGPDGFYLDFSDPNDIGKDRTGNGNDLVPTGFQLDSPDAVNYALLKDTPVNNYSSLNPFDQNFGQNVVNANRTYYDNEASGGATRVNSWFAITEGSYFAEFEATNVGSTPSVSVGVTSGTVSNNSDSNGAIGTQLGEIGYHVDGTIRANNSQAAVGESWGAGDIIGIRVEFEENKISFYKNGVYQARVIQAADQYYFATAKVSGLGSAVYVNYGERPFSYPIDGALAFSSKRLNSVPVPKSTDHFRVLTGSGASILNSARGLSNANEGTGFRQGLWWIKDRANTNQHQLAASILDGNQAIVSPQTNPNSQDFLAPSGNSVAWCWNCPDTFTSAVSETFVSARRNVDAGFSMVRLTSSGGSSSETYEHGLNVEPDVILMTRVSPRDASWTVRVWMPEFADSGDNAGLLLNSNSALLTNLDQTKPTAVDSTEVTYSSLSSGTGDLVAFNWTAVPGYSKFGVYNGNNDDDGTYVDLGFKPALVILKRKDGNGDWVIKDASRETSNPNVANLYSNLTTSETFPSDEQVIFTSNGFKVAGSDSDVNQGEVLYMAWAAMPTAGKNVSPATADIFGPPVYESVLPGLAQSLRFSGTQTLSRTFTSQDNIGTFTFSAWIKRTGIGTYDTLIGAGTSSPWYDIFRFIDSNDVLQYAVTGGTTTSPNTAPAVFRDSTGWYHVVLNSGYPSDGQPAHTNIFVNGINVSSEFNLGSSAVEYINRALPHAIGGASINGPVADFEGYMSNIHFIDGQKLNPDSFAEYNSEGVWIPKDYSGTYGGNGFHLVMDPAFVKSGLLLDQSPNGNDWTLNGFQISDFYVNTFDFMKDGPTQNYSTWNSLLPISGTVTDGNLTYVTPTADNTAIGNFTFNTSDNVNYYAEFKFIAQNAASAGICSVKHVSVNASVVINQPFSALYCTNGRVYQNGSIVATDTIVDNYDVVGLLFESGTRTVSFTVNGVTQPTTLTVPADLEMVFCGGDNTGQFGSGNSNVIINCGQQPFLYTPPAGFLPLQSQSLQPTISNGRDHFDVVTYSGDSNNSTNVTGLNFEPDLVWIKNRNNGAGNDSNVASHMIYDSIRDVRNSLMVDSTASEENLANGLQSFNSNGFRPGSLSRTNESSSNYVAWCWKAGGAAVANNDGTLASQVSVNTTSGFSIVTYDASGPVTDTVGHGLGQAPDIVIAKRRDGVDNWIVYHNLLTSGSSNYLKLNTNEAQAQNPGPAPTSTVFNPYYSLGTDSSYVAYCWHSVPGFSKIDFYQGNGNMDGPFVHCGFRPAFIVVKNVGIGSWFLYDTTRRVTNPVDNALFSNSTSAEVQQVAANFDILSNGFKIRGTGSDVNFNNQTYVFMAFAENPQGSSSSAPANAR